MDDKKKYELIPTDKTFNDKPLYQIRSLIHFTNPYMPDPFGERWNNHFEVNPGDLGGYVSGEHNLSHRDCCWICKGAIVCDNAEVLGMALITNEHYRGAEDDAQTIVKDRASVYGSARICGGSVISDDARINCRSIVENTIVSDAANIRDNLIVMNSIIEYNAVLSNENYTMTVSEAHCKSGSEFYTIDNVGTFIRFVFYPNKERDQVKISVLPGFRDEPNHFLLEEFKKKIIMRSDSQCQYKSEVLLALDLGSVYIRNRILCNDKLFKDYRIE